MIYIYSENEQWVRFKEGGANGKNCWGYQVQGFGWLLEVGQYYFKV